jgi:hypothetical protein
VRPLPDDSPQGPLEALWAADPFPYFFRVAPALWKLIRPIFSAFSRSASVRSDRSLLVSFVFICRSLAFVLHFWYRKFMNVSIRGIKKKRGRPKTTGSGIQIGVRWHEPMVQAIDAWAARQEDKPERAEAIRRLVERQLAAEPIVAKPRRAKRKAD